MWGVVAGRREEDREGGSLADISTNSGFGQHPNPTANVDRNESLATLAFVTMIIYSD